MNNKKDMNMGGASTTETTQPARPAKSIQKLMAERLNEEPDDKITRNIKDSIFCNLFSRPEYLIELYRALHPEDTETTPDDLTLVTLQSTFVKSIYNDLGFLAGNRLLVLVEAPSTWSENILIRFLMYLGETYHRYIEKNRLNIYNSRKIDLPRPELYVIYTGERQNRPDYISLKDSFFEGQEYGVDITAHVIYDSMAGDILSQFITFSKVFDRKRLSYPNAPKKAIQETIRVCRQNDILKTYLEEEEAALIMIEIMDQKKALEFAFKEERAEGVAEGMAKGKAEGMAEGMAEGKAETVKDVAKTMHEEGFSPEVIARIVKLTEEEVLAILEEQDS